MGGALLSGGHQSSSPFIVGFAGFILAQEGLRRAHVSSRIKGISRLRQVNNFFSSRAPPESRKTQCFFLDPETIENQIIYFDPKKTSRIIINSFPIRSYCKKKNLPFPCHEFPERL